MHNYKYKIIDDYVEIYLSKRNGEQFTCLIDLEDLDKFINHKYRWYPNINHAGHYICSTIYLGMIDGKFRNKRIYLHRFLINCPHEYHVDHFNNNTLDNRKNNLRVTENKFNIRHRKSKNTNNTSGYRNVSWNKDINKWVIQLQVDGTNKVLGTFDNLDNAGKFAEEMRKKYYKDYAGAS